MQGTEQQVMEADAMALEGVFRESLLERKRKLQDALVFADDDFEFASLLGEVNAALAKLDSGTFGKCEECTGHVETDRLLADPLVRVCLSELSDRDRQSLEDDLELASSIQRNLLPQAMLEHPHWSADYHYQPLGVVSGDYCDIIPSGDDVYFILGDVSGKGMAASLMMSSLHAIFNTLIPLGLGLEEIMSRANHLIVDSSPANQFATLVCGRARPDGIVELVNAGHLPPLLIRNRIAGELNSAGLPLGMFAHTKFSSNAYELDASDAILLYTDGLTESADHSGIEYGNAGLLATVNGNNWAGPGDLIRNCVEDSTRHRGEAERTDDLTMLALSYK